MRKSSLITILGLFLFLQASLCAVDSKTLELAEYQLVKKINDLKTQLTKLRGKAKEDKRVEIATLQDKLKILRGSGEGGEFRIEEAEPKTPPPSSTQELAVKYYTIDEKTGEKRELTPAELEERIKGPTGEILPPPPPPTPSKKDAPIPALLGEKKEDKKPSKEEIKPKPSAPKPLPDDLQQGTKGLKHVDVVKTEKEEELTAEQKRIVARRKALETEATGVTSASEKSIVIIAQELLSAKSRPIDVVAKIQEHCDEAIAPFLAVLDEKTIKDFLGKFEDVTQNIVTDLLKNQKMSDVANITKELLSSIIKDIESEKLKNLQRDSSLFRGIFEAIRPGDKKISAEGEKRGFYQNVIDVLKQKEELKKIFTKFFELIESKKLQDKILVEAILICENPKIAVVIKDMDIDLHKKRLALVRTIKAAKSKAAAVAPSKTFEAAVMEHKGEGEEEETEEEWEG